MTAGSPDRADRASAPAEPRADLYRAQEQAKPWGHEMIYAGMDGKYVGKVIYVTAGQSLSLQYHQHKDETLSRPVASYWLEQTEGNL